MITFYNNSRENIKKAILEYEAVDGEKNDYYVLDPETLSSDMSTYIVNFVYDHEPTSAELRALAEQDWKDYYEGINSDDEKEDVIKEMIDNYLVVNRRILFNPISNIREDYELTQEELSSKTGIPIKTLRNWEQGQRECKDYMVDLIRCKLETLVK